MASKSTRQAFFDLWVRGHAQVIITREGYRFYLLSKSYFEQKKRGLR